jgi:IPT/TIG domain-containing protein
MKARRHRIGLAGGGRGFGRKAGRFAAHIATAASALALLGAGSAQASTITVGSVLPTTFASTPFGQVETFFNTALPEKGANLTSPVNGAIVRWRVQGAKGGPFFLRVLHPNGSGAYAASGTSGPATPSGTGLQTFNANLPVHAGDLIGIDPTSAADEIGVAEVAGASYAYIFPPPLDGATVPPSGSVAGKEVELSAEVQPAPEITSISPASGSIAGGTTVTIKGTNLGAASAVKFGTSPAASFTATSETEITATAPRSVKPGTVDVTVTTLAGTNPTARADRFTYVACIVPKLKGKTLKVAKRLLRGSHCKLGHVTRRGGATPKTGRVAKQSRKPRKVLPLGAAVGVTLKP